MRLLFQEDPAVHDDYQLVVTADAAGNIYWDQWAPEPHDVGVRFYLLASDSRSRAQITFTDGNLSSTITFGIGPTSVTPGDTLNWQRRCSLCGWRRAQHLRVGRLHTQRSRAERVHRRDSNGRQTRALTLNLTILTTVSTTSGAVSGSFAAPTSVLQGLLPRAS